MNSVATKPVKPCDGGVFRGQNLLSKIERNRHKDQGRIQDQVHIGSHIDDLNQLCEQLFEPVRGLAVNRFLKLPAPKTNYRRFRYGFDSSKARQTVRWRYFLGLEFAPEKRAKRTSLGLFLACALARTGLNRF